MIDAECIKSKIQKVKVHLHEIVLEKPGLATDNIIIFFIVNLNEMVQIDTYKLMHTLLPLL